jgi:hypothetical protein
MAMVKRILESEKSNFYPIHYFTTKIKESYFSIDFFKSIHINYYYRYYIENDNLYEFNKITKLYLNNIIFKYQSVLMFIIINYKTSKIHLDMINIY